MTDDPPNARQASAGRVPDSCGNLRDLFPAYFAPDEARMREHFTRGLVVLDTNALLSVYRFNPQAREEFLDVLHRLGDRLWIPHQVGKEFHLNRRDVLLDGHRVIDVFMDKVRQKVQPVHELIRELVQRRGGDADRRAELVEIVDAMVAALEAKASEFWVFDIDPDAEPDEDPIYRELEALLDGRVGPPPSDGAADHAEGMRRAGKGVPPGYMDARKKDGRGTGDYQLWVQTIRKARDAGVPVLLVTNDAKEDWVQFTPSGAALGPRNELILEMRKQAGQPFHLLDVPEFLLHAPEHLAATVSDSTVEQAKAGAISTFEEVMDLATSASTSASGLGAQRLEHALKELLRDNPEIVRSPVERALVHLQGIQVTPSLRRLWSEGGPLAGGYGSVGPGDDGAAGPEDPRP